MVTKPRAASLEFRGPTRRTAERQQIAVPGRITWRDSRGMTRFASVVARDSTESEDYVGLTSTTTGAWSLRRCDTHGS